MDTANSSPSSSATIRHAADNANANVGVQAAFIAQLAAQDATQETHVALLQYEKLVEISNVKYKPSDAFKPSADPSSLFSRLVSSEKPQPE